ncbi:hypothetical protein [Cellulosilyticum ruminicola]|uniref:hypothetical protein n=1 Tax=Cellulosilyticum ruminicola TaxID=425254 RepID=UPI0006D03667|nr:hypothetical protein [Cellulosilyticum ruminicola]
MDLVNHPAFANTDKSFLIYLQKTLSTLTYKSDIEVIATLMAISNEASKKNVHFTPDMQVALLEYLKSRLPVNKRHQFEAMIKTFTTSMNKSK